MLLDQLQLKCLINHEPAVFYNVFHIIMQLRTNPDVMTLTFSSASDCEADWRHKRLLNGTLHVASSLLASYNLITMCERINVRYTPPQSGSPCKMCFRRFWILCFSKIYFFKVYDSLIHFHTLWAIPNIWCTKIPFLYLHMYFWHGNYYNTGLVFVLLPLPFIYRGMGEGAWHICHTTITVF